MTESIEQIKCNQRQPLSQKEAKRLEAPTCGGTIFRLQKEHIFHFQADDPPLMHTRHGFETHGSNLRPYFLLP